MYTNESRERATTAAAVNVRIARIIRLLVLLDGNKLFAVKSRTCTRVI